MTLPPRPAPPPPPKWATEISGRTPRFKMHATYGQVRAAIGYRMYGRGVRGGKVFEWRDDVWVLLWDVAPGTLKSTHEFFRGTQGGPQDVDRMALAAERHRQAEIKRLQERLDALLRDAK